MYRKKAKMDAMDQMAKHGTPSNTVGVNALNVISVTSIVSIAGHVVATYHIIIKLSRTNNMCVRETEETKYTCLAEPVVDYESDSRWTANVTARGVVGDP